MKKGLLKRICGFTLAMAMTLVGSFLPESSKLREYLPQLSTTAEALTINHTVDEGIAYVKALYESQELYQCVAFVNQYIYYLCGDHIPMNNTVELINNGVPSKYPFTLVQNATPQKGDILLWKMDNDVGHIGIFESTTSVYDSNWAENEIPLHHILPCEHGSTWKSLASNYWGVLRPNFGYPICNLDELTAGEGTVRIRGWAFDPDDYNAALELHIYIGGDYGAWLEDPTKVERITGVYADQLSDDVNKIYGCGNYHRFDLTLNTNLTGTQEVYVHAIDIGNAYNPRITNDSISNFVYIQPAPITDINDCTIAAISDRTYTGGSITPAVTIKNGTKTLVKNTDYIIEYTDNIHAGTATVTITGIGSYTGTRTVTFEILPKSITDLTFKSISSQVYTGSEIEPAVTIMNGEYPLTLNKHYTVNYSSNLNVGTASAVITGTGDYTGTKTLSFNITKATPVVTAPTAKDLHYYGKSQTLINAGSTTLGTLEYSLDGTTYSTSLPTAWKAGTYTVYYRVTGTSNYNSVAAKTISVTITKNKATVTAPTAKTITYNGAARELVTAGSTTYGKLQYSLDGTNYSENIPTATNAGTYKVYYKVDGTENYDGFAAQTVSVKILPKSITALTFKSISSQVYTGSEIEPAVTIMNGEYPLTLNKHYTVTYSNNVNVGTASTVITGTGNYTGTTTLNFSITKATPVVTAPTAKDLHYYGKSQTLINAGSTTLGTLEYSLDGTTYSTSLPTAWKAGTYTVYYRVTGTSNYNSVAAKTISVTITKNKATVTAPTAKTLTYNGEVQELIEAGYTTYGKLQYSLDGINYSESIPTATNAGTYTVYYKVDGTENYDGFEAQTITVVIESILEITTQPVDFNGAIGDTAIFAVEASGENLTYQWEQNTGSGWVALNTTAGKRQSISIPVAAFRAGYQYRCIVSDGTTTLISDVAAIKLAEVFEITAQPADFVGKVGDTAKFNVEATGAASYQWYQNTGSGWVAMNTAAGRSKSISIPVVAFRVGFQYKCIISDGTNTLTSDIVSIKLAETLTITTQPADFVGNIGDTAKFTVEATAATSYQWYQNTGSGWVALNTAAGRSNTISIAVAQFRVGFQYKCEVSDGTNTLTSNIVSIKLDEVLGIKTQPVDYVGAIGDTAKFTITATGVKYYQWQQNTGSGWVNINTAAGRSNSISIAVAEFRVGYQYRCMISDGTTLIASDVAAIRLEGETLAITGQPEDFVGTIGGNATFTVTATGATSYQWYQNTGSGWVAINTAAGRSNKITIPVAAFRVGFQYRCEVSDGTTTITSDAATLLI